MNSVLSESSIKDKSHLSVTDQVFMNGLWFRGFGIETKHMRKYCDGSMNLNSMWRLSKKIYRKKKKKQRKEKILKLPVSV